MQTDEETRMLTKSGLISLNGRRVLITGANGFIGGHLVDALDGLGALVTIVDMRHGYFKPTVREYVGDLCDADFTEACIKECSPEIIIHLAASKDRSADIVAFSHAISTNLTGSINLFASAMKLKGLKSVVVLGTAEEYGKNPTPFVEDMRERPVSAYSYSKLCVTRLCETLYSLHRTPFVVLRPTVAYGPGQGPEMFLPALIKTLLAKKEFPMTHGIQTRDFVYVADLINAILSASVTPQAAGQVINIGSGNPVAIAEIAVKVARLLGREDLLRIGALDYRCGEAMEYCVDTSRALQLLDWTASFSLDEGLRHTIEHYQRGL